MEVKHIGNPVLREVSTEIDPAEIKSEKIQGFIDDLIQQMHESNGAGIAAVQVGHPIRIFAMEVNNNPRYPYKPTIPLTVMINPKIKPMTDKQFENYEGCLSVPGLRGKVKRNLEIEVEYYDREGTLHTQVFKGITAGTVQHEYDHLDGVLFIDKVADPKTLTTWDEFKKSHEADFIQTVKEIVEEYGS